MSESIEEIQNLLLNFQKLMKSKSSTVRGQWNALTCLENISAAQIARRLNVFGINATNIDVTQLFYYLDIKKNSMGFNDFIRLMETDPSSLGPKTRRISQSKEIEHETLRAYEDDYNTYCKRTPGYTPTVQTRNSLTKKSSKKITRPFTAPKGSKKTKGGIRSNSNNPDANYYDDDQYIPTDEQPISTNPMEANVTFTYEPCKTVLERSLPRNASLKRARETTLQSFSNTAIQRQYYDGADATDSIENNNNNAMTLRELVTKISDVAYITCKSSWKCFLKWRDPHHDLLEATDLRTGLKLDGKVEISLADAQKVIDYYGGPMTHSTFAVMLHDGSHFNQNKSFGYDEV